MKTVITLIFLFLTTAVNAETWICFYKKSGGGKSPNKETFINNGDHFSWIKEYTKKTTTLLDVIKKQKKSYVLFDDNYVVILTKSDKSEGLLKVTTTSAYQENTYTGNCNINK